MSRRARGVLGAAITLLLLWWVLRDVSPSSVWAEVRGANPWWLLAAVVLATFNFVLRAIRWRVLLEPGQGGSSFEARFGSTCAGFAANNIFPARLGEFIRAYVLSRVAAVPLGASVGSLVVERVLDGLVLASFLAGAILSPTFPLGDTEAAAWVERTAMVASVVFAIGFLTMWAAARRPAGTLRVWEATGGRIVPDRFADRATDLVTTLIHGFGALARLHVLVRAVLWSLVVWVCLGLSIWAGLLAFGITAPGFVGSMFLQAVIGFSVALPSTPGFFGVFEAGARIGLQPWDIGDAVIVSFATSYHILTFIPVTVLGLLYVRRIGLRWSDVRRQRSGEGGTLG
ncbi:MAG: lysylphosphatidylglycerol synthase transmembrane domain-containing protein [Gemmatimonadota bacterium]|nr:lysylphosphatidylglycerol synthase transmembrane domain-containing protein [Gemmatimonadota bacterium]